MLTFEDAESYPWDKYGLIYVHHQYGFMSAYTRFSYEEGYRNIYFELGNSRRKCITFLKKILN